MAKITGIRVTGYLTGATITYNRKKNGTEECVTHKILNNNHCILVNERLSDEYWTFALCEIVLKKLLLLLHTNVQSPYLVIVQ